MSCGEKGSRKHTPITSEKQRGLFGAEYARRKEEKEGRMGSITTKELRSHLKETKGKELPMESHHYSSGEGRSQRDNFNKKRKKP